MNTLDEDGQYVYFISILPPARNSHMLLDFMAGI